MRVPKFEKVVDEFCRFQETIDLLTMVCIDVQSLGCESFEGGCEAMTLYIIMESCRFQLLIVDCTAGNILFFHRAAVKSIQNQSKHRFIYLSS